jgi:hypothetical protein
VFERYRAWFLIGATLVGVAIVALIVIASQPTTAFSCGSLLTPGPSETDRPGFPTENLGRTHVPNGSHVDYGFCPPTSGNHYFATGVAPLPRQFFGPTDDVRPQQWVHNLEHGYVAILYQGTPDQATLASMQDVMNSATPTTVAQACGLPNKVIAARFDQMSTPFAVVAWDRALLLPQWDPNQALDFANHWQDDPAHPEPGVC